MKKQVIFLTGSTGFLGSRVLKRLMNDESLKLFCLVRSTAGIKGAKKKIEKVNKIDLSHLSNVEVVAGDITKEKFGLDHEIYSHLQNTITDIVHCAASTKFSAPVDELRKLNVEPVERLKQLAIEIDKQSDRKVNIIHVSTAYCVGHANGVINEHEHAKPESGFKNNYERSKWQAEKRLLKDKDKIKTVIVRPSIIIGSDKGECNRSGVVIPLFSIMRKNSKKYPTPIPLPRKIFFDMVSVDYVAECVISALKKVDQLESGDIFHATAGLGKELTGKVSVKSFNTKFGIKMVGLNTSVYWWLLRFLAKYTNLVNAIDRTIMEAYANYFKTHPRFDNTKMLGLLNDEYKSIDAKVLLENTIDYWIANFDRN